MINKIGIYPGTFDPITFGHIDVIKRALKIVNYLVIGVADDQSKNYFFSSEERAELIKKSLFNDMKLKRSRIKITIFNDLTTNFCKKNKANIIFRGLRAVSDFEYEFQLAGMNRNLNKEIETVFLMSDPESQVISSKLVKEVALLKGNISKFASRSVIKAINNRILWKRYYFFLFFICFIYQ